MICHISYNLKLSQATRQSSNMSVQPEKILISDSPDHVSRATPILKRSLRLVFSVILDIFIDIFIKRDCSTCHGLLKCLHVSKLLAVVQYMWVGNTALVYNHQTMTDQKNRRVSWFAMIARCQIVSSFVRPWAHFSYSHAVVTFVLIGTYQTLAGPLYKVEV